MIRQYIQNKSLNMTVEHYYEMCEALGTEPKEEDIPLTPDDFPIDVQQAWSLYTILPNKFDGFSGEYQGKNLSNFIDYCKLLNITEDILDMFRIVSIIDTEETSVVRSKQSSKAQQGK